MNNSEETAFMTLGASGTVTDLTMENDPDLLSDDLTHLSSRYAG